MKTRTGQAGAKSLSRKKFQYPSCVIRRTVIETAPRRKVTPQGEDDWLSGRSSGVEHNLAKVGVVGSNPIARSRIFPANQALRMLAVFWVSGVYGHRTPRSYSCVGHLSCRSDQGGCPGGRLGDVPTTGTKEWQKPQGMEALCGVRASIQGFLATKADKALPPEDHH